MVGRGWREEVTDGQRDPMLQDDRTKILSPTREKQSGGGVAGWGRERKRNEWGWADQRILG